MKLHIGCGRRYIKGWKHVDIQWDGHIDFVAEAHHLDMIEDGFCEVVYASHVLEYYDWEAAFNVVLPEWNRVLIKGGILRVAVPDFTAMAGLYFSENLSLDRLIGPLYGKMQSNGETIYHRCVYDEEKLREMLLANGFHSVQRYDWRKTEHADVDDCSQAYIPKMQKETGTLISLNMEAIKG